MLKNSYSYKIYLGLKEYYLCSILVNVFNSFFDSISRGFENSMFIIYKNKDTLAVHLDESKIFESMNIVIDKICDIVNYIVDYCVATYNNSVTKKILVSVLDVVILIYSGSLGSILVKVFLLDERV